MGFTTIRVRDETADDLHRLKLRGDSYDDVIRRLIERTTSEGEFQDALDRLVRDVEIEKRRSSIESSTSSESSADVKPVDEWIDGLDLPGTGPQLDRRREAVRATYNLIRERGAIQPREMKDELYQEHAGGYGSEKSWWVNLVLPALRDLAELDDDLYPPGNPRSSNPWQYDG